MQYFQFKIWVSRIEGAGPAPLPTGWFFKHTKKYVVFKYDTSDVNGGCEMASALIRHFKSQNVTVCKFQYKIKEVDMPHIKALEN